MLRTSSYTIYVDLPDSQEMLLVHTYTGTFDKVSQRVATYVRSLDVSRPPKPLYGQWTPEPTIDGEVTAPSDATLELLQKRGYLTSLTKEEEEDFFKRYVEKLYALYARRPPSFLLIPTYDCNLRCSYCFQDHMRTDEGFRHLLPCMSPSTVDRLFKAMLKIESLHGITPDAVPRRDIGLFGGEPLLAENRPVVEYIINKGLERGQVRFWAISNGTQLDAYEDLLGPERLAAIQITLDGPPRHHDQRRVAAGGGGSWDRIAPNVTMALDQGVKINIRTNVDRGNFEHLIELADELISRGWDRYPNFRSHVSPIRPTNDKTDPQATLDSWELNRRLTQMREQHSNLKVIGLVDDSLRNQAHRIFTTKGLPTFKPSFCAAHTGMYIFDAFGDIYACWEKTGDEQVKIGHVDEDGDAHLNAEIHTMWRKRTVASNPACLNCRYNMFCGGGCAMLALENQGGFYTNYCDGYAHRFRQSVAAAYLDFASGKDLANKPEAFCEL